MAIKVKAFDEYRVMVDRTSNKSVVKTLADLEADLDRAKAELTRIHKEYAASVFGAEMAIADYESILQKANAFGIKNPPQEPLTRPAGERVPR